LFFATEVGRRRGRRHHRRQSQRWRELLLAPL